MVEFPRTMVGGVSLPRLLIGTNWFMGYSHTSQSKDRFIKGYQSRERIAETLAVFLSYGIDAVVGSGSEHLENALKDAEQKAGRKMIRIFTPSFHVGPNGPVNTHPEDALDEAKEMGATFCLPHQCVTDALVDRMYGTVRDFDRYAAMIRDRGMIPGLSTHLPEAVVFADKTGIDVETYIQIYNAAGFMMPLETDWEMRVISNAKKPVITIKPLAAGRLLPVVGLAFVWNTIRDQDMVTIGAMTPDEARESIELSLDLLNRRIPSNELQRTRSKTGLA